MSRVLVKGRKLKATQRSLTYLRKQGYRAEVCEQYRSRVEGKGQQAKFKGGFRKDLFGFMDILAYGRGPHSVLGVQATSRQQITTHLRQYRRDPKVREAILDWLTCPGRRFVILGFECVEVPKVSGDGTKAEWQCTEREVTADMLYDAGAERKR